MGPPPLPAQPVRNPGSSLVRQPVVVLLNLFLALFLADAVLSLMDDTGGLLFGMRPLASIRGLVGTFALLLAFVIYLLMGFTPLIPKRVFLPVTLACPVAMLLGLFVMIYWYSRMTLFTWLVSLGQVAMALCVLWYLRRRTAGGWPIVRDEMLGPGGFNWVKTGAFVLLNLFVVLPGAIAYLVLCAGLAIHHFSEGFVALKPGGFTVQVRKYARADGKTILLVPMSHVGEPEFYRSLAQGFPTNSAILMEGVTDTQNLLTNRITYRRMASSLGLAPQEKQFKPNPTQMVWADIDVAQFKNTTMDFLNLVMLIHSKGLSVPNLMLLMQYPQPPDFERQLFNDLVNKRNQHLVEVVQEQLGQENNLIVPWGAAHMPGIAREIMKSGFRLVDTREYVAIRFGKKTK